MGMLHEILANLWGNVRGVGQKVFQKLRKFDVPFRFQLFDSKITKDEL